MRYRAGLGAGLVVAGLAVSAGAQPAAPPSPSAPRLGAAVIRPPSGVDPGMKVTPKSAPHLPTPVIRPPVQKGDAVMVPK